MVWWRAVFLTKQCRWYGLLFAQAAWISGIMVPSKYFLSGYRADPIKESWVVYWNQANWMVLQSALLAQIQTTFHEFEHLTFVSILFFSLNLFNVFYDELSSISFHIVTMTQRKWPNLSVFPSLWHSPDKWRSDGKFLSDSATTWSRSSSNLKFKLQILPLILA